jgi:hypothetical protein
MSKPYASTHPAGPATRAFTVKREAVNLEARTATLAFASETPYERYWGVEILDVTAASMRTGRLRSGANLLMDHDSTDVVGVVDPAAPRAVDPGPVAAADADVDAAPAADADDADDDAAAGCALSSPRPWTVSRDLAWDALVDSEIAVEDDDDGWSAAPESGGRAGPDERVKKPAVQQPVALAARARGSLGSAWRAPAYDPAVFLGVDVLLASHWSVGAQAAAASRAREGVRVTSVGGGLGAGHSWELGRGVRLNVGAGLGAAIDVVQGNQSIDLVPSLAGFVPLVVGFDVGGGVDVEGHLVVRVTDATVDGSKAGRAVWEGGPVSCFVGLGASFGGRNDGDP